MDRVNTWVPGELVASADLNEIQDREVSYLDVAPAFTGVRPRLSWASASTLAIVSPARFGASNHNNASRIPSQNQTITPATILGSALANSTWYYLYVFNSGTRIAPVLSFLVSTTGPDPLRHAHGADFNAAYVGCFRTDGSGNILPFYCINGRYTWRQSAAAGTPFSLGSFNGTGSPHELSLATRVPPHAFMARVRLQINCTGAAVVSLQTNGDSAGLYDYSDLALIAGTQLAEQFEILTDSSQKLKLAVANAGVRVEVLGFEE